MESEDIILSLEHITKIYPGVVALDDVSLSVRRGEIHAIVGENGAGKSTLIKTITGAITTDAGTVTVNGEAFSHMTPAIARGHGIECIYQEFNLVDTLSAGENICFGKKSGRFVNQKKINKFAREVFARFKIDIDPSVMVDTLSTGKRQIIEIAKAVSKGAKILIMDEPTAPLSNSEVEVLMNIIAELRREGVTILYISHRLDEIFRISDRVSVFRDGKYIITMDTDKTSRPELIRHMVGRELGESYPRRKTPPGEVALELRNLTGNGVKNISFQARRGEVLGMSGLVGAGRSEIMKVAYGAEKRQWGEILVHGKPVNIRSPRDAMANGIGLIPEDRKREGVFLMESICWNIVYNISKKISRFTVVNKKKEKEISTYYRENLRIKTPGLDQKVLNLSGGNQQKVVVAKALAANLDIIIFDEPTRGIDVGAKHEIYELMNELCAGGKCIIMITSDMEELLGMSDRIIVLHERRQAGEIARGDFSQEHVLALASGVADM